MTETLMEATQEGTEWEGKRTADAACLCCGGRRRGGGDCGQEGQQPSAEGQSDALLSVRPSATPTRRTREPHQQSLRALFRGRVFAQSVAGLVASEPACGGAVADCRGSARWLLHTGCCEPSQCQAGREGVLPALPRALSSLDKECAPPTSPAWTCLRARKLTPLGGGWGLSPALQDRSFTFVLKTPPASILLMKAAGVERGSNEPNKVKVGKVTVDQVRAIAQEKLPDLNCTTIESAMRIVAGTAANMGIDVDPPILQKKEKVIL